MVRERGPHTGLVAYGYNSVSDVNDWIDRHRQKPLLDPEHRLMMAILEYAIEEANYKDGFTYKPSTHNSSQAKRERNREQARAWIEQPDTGRYSSVFSFDSVCGYLGLDPSATRKRLMKAYG